MRPHGRQSDQPLRHRQLDALTYNQDGSLDVYIQKDSPSKAKKANWLPAAAGDFSVTMRVYWPKPAMLDGSWEPPPVKRVN